MRVEKPPEVINLVYNLERDQIISIPSTVERRKIFLKRLVGEGGEGGNVGCALVEYFQTQAQVPGRRN